MTSTEIAKAAVTELVQRAAELVAAGKLSLLDALKQVRELPALPEPKAVRVAPITDGQRAALARLPEVYGQVVPKTPRMLKPLELSKLAEERDTIDEILALVKERKDVSIREAVLNHFDLAAERDHGATPGVTPVDANGHYLARDEANRNLEIPVPDRDEKWVWQVSDGSVQISSAQLQAAYKAGAITREQWMAITKPAEVKREFDEPAARTAIRENPDLMLLIAEHGVTQGRGRGSLYLRPDKG